MKSPCLHTFVYIHVYICLLLYYLSIFGFSEIFRSQSKTKGLYDPVYKALKNPLMHI